MSRGPSLRHKLGPVLLVFWIFQQSSISSATANPAPIMELDFELLDTSLDDEVKGLDPDEQNRLKLISKQLRDLAGASERHSIVDTASAVHEIAGGGNTDNSWTHGVSRLARNRLLRN